MRRARWAPVPARRSHQAGQDKAPAPAETALPPPSAKQRLPAAPTSCRRPTRPGGRPASAYATAAAEHPSAAAARPNTTFRNSSSVPAPCAGCWRVLGTRPSITCSDRRLLPISARTGRSRQVNLNSGRFSAVLGSMRPEASIMNSPNVIGSMAILLPRRVPRPDGSIPHWPVFRTSPL